MVALVASNLGGQEIAGPELFSTPAVPPVASAFVTEVAANSASLGAEINPGGAATTYHFDYGTTAAYGQSTPESSSIGADNTNHRVELPVQGLLPETVYHYRAVAANAVAPGGTSGPDQTFITQANGAVAAGALPDNRVWELVSPPNKHGSPLEPITEEGGVIQAAANGDAFGYVALGPITPEPPGAPSIANSQLLATRGPSGWATQDITTPHEEVAIFNAGEPSEYRQFSADLSAGLVEPRGATPLSPQTTERTPYRREANGQYVPLVTATNVPPGTKFGGVESTNLHGIFDGGVVFKTASPDLSHIVLSSPQALAPGFAPGFTPAENPNLYELSGGTLRLISVLPPNAKGEELPAAESALSAGVGHSDLNMRGAISTDGNRVVFEAGQHLYLRDVGVSKTVQLDVPQEGAPGGSPRPEFQGASSDGSKVFFTDTEQLTSDPSARTEGRDLYMCEVAINAGQLSCALSDLTVDLNEGEPAEAAAGEGVSGGGEVSAVDAAGRYVYFAANGVLTSAPNVRGEHAVPGECHGETGASCNMYVYDTASRGVQLVAVLSSADAPDWDGSPRNILGNLTARVSPSGRYLAFMSQRSLTGYHDNRDARSGERDEEVFLFDVSAGGLTCVSCNPSGARPHGVFDKNEFQGLLVDHPKSWRETWLAGSIPGWTLVCGGACAHALYRSRYLSDSGRMFFNSADALVPQDTNGVEDVYQ